MVFSSPRSGGPIMSPEHALERRIFDAYQEVKRARRDGDYATICGWISEVDYLLDRCAELHAKSPGVDVRMITGYEQGAL
jgi:hypothetical protein